MTWLSSLLWMISIGACIVTRAWGWMFALSLFPVVLAWSPMTRKMVKDPEAILGRLLLTFVCGALVLLSAVGTFGNCASATEEFLVAASALTMAGVLVRFVATL